MQTFDALLHEAEVAHGHPQAAIDPGRPPAYARLCQRLGIDDPKGPTVSCSRHLRSRSSPLRHRMPSALSPARRLGKRAIKFRVRLGKDGLPPSSTFFSPPRPQGDTPIYKPSRIAALSPPAERVPIALPPDREQNQQQMPRIPRSFPDPDLFSASGSPFPSTPRQGRCPATNPPASPAKTVARGHQLRPRSAPCAKRNRANSLRRLRPSPVKLLLNLFTGRTLATNSKASARKPLRHRPCETLVR